MEEENNACFAATNLRFKNTIQLSHQDLSNTRLNITFEINQTFPNHFV